MRKPIPLASSLGAETVTAKKKINAVKAYANATFYIPNPTYKRLAGYAHENETSIQQILEEALDEWLMKRHEAPFYPEDWDKTLGKKALLPE